MEDREIIELYWARDERSIRETDLRYGGYLRKIAMNVLSVQAGGVRGGRVLPRSAAARRRGGLYRKARGFDRDLSEVKKEGSCRMFRKSCPLLISFHLVAGRRQSLQRLTELFGLHQDVVGVVGGDGEDADPVLRQDPGDRGQDADEGEVQDAFYAEAPPAVLPLGGLRRRVLRPADEGDLLVGSPDEVEVTGEVQSLGARDFADGQRIRQGFQFRIVSFPRDAP